MFWANIHSKLNRFLEDLLEGKWLSEINPTVLLTLILVFFWVVILSAALFFHQLPFYAYIPLGAIQVLLVFMMFTPLHDSVHFTASRRKILNEIILFLNWPIFVNNPFLFRRIHLKHHSRTNQGDSDPDHFTSHPKMGMQILKSFFLVFHYHLYAFRHFNTWKMRAQIVASILTPVLIIYLAVVTPFTWPILFVWVLPAFVASGFLSFFNTAFPHHPGKDARRFQNTRVAYVPWIVQLVLFNQNLHLVHHLKPTLSWYEYPEYWRQHQEDILAKGAKVVYLTNRKEAYALVPQIVLQKAHETKDRIQFYLSQL